MQHSMPPGQIMLLIQIHCFVYQDQITIDNGSPASRKFYDRLLRDELIEIGVAPDDYFRVRHPFNTTSRGRALIEKWCETPLPILEEKWV